MLGPLSSPVDATEGSIRQKSSTPAGVSIGLPASNAYAQRHFRISELAKLWRLGRETVRRLVKDDPEVIKIRLGRKKAHTTYSVPESVAQRIHTRLLNVG